MKGKKVNYPLLDTGVPAMSNPGVHFLSTHIQPNHVVFEWGSGASTFWLAQRCNTIWSAEYFEDFYDVLKERSENISNIHLIFQPPDKIARDGYIATHSSAKGYSFYNFAHTVDKFRDNYFDIIIIDGRVRNRCLDLAMPKLRQNGIIVFDDTNRKPYMDYLMGYADKFKKVMHFEGQTIDKKQTTTSVLYKKL